MFKIGDKVKWAEDNYSVFMWYGVVVKVNRKTLKIEDEAGKMHYVDKKLVNFN